jgi:hypothetical protein
MVIPAAQSAVAAVLMYDPEYATHVEILPVIGVAGDWSESDEWRSSSTHAYPARSGPGLRSLQLRWLPVRRVTAVYEDPQARHGSFATAFASETLLTEGVDFAPEYDMYGSDNVKVCGSGLITRIGGGWSTEPGTVKVEYGAGYTATELQGVDAAINARPIKEAILMTALRSFRQYALHQKTAAAGFVGGIKTSESLGDYSYSVGSGGEAAMSFGVMLAPEARAMLDPFINYGASFQ